MRPLLVLALFLPHLAAAQRTPPPVDYGVVETVNGFFLDLKTAGVILGAKAWFDETDNPVDSLKAGKLRIDYDYAVPPPLEDLGFNQRITDSYFADFASQLSQAG